jgi:hypothetical protein
MFRKLFLTLSSMAALLSFIACLCLGVAFVATGMTDIAYLVGTGLCVVWSHLASCQVEALETPEERAARGGFGLTAE